MPGIPGADLFCPARSWCYFCWKSNKATTLGLSTACSQVVIHLPLHVFSVSGSVIEVSDIDKVIWFHVSTLLLDASLRRFIQSESPVHSGFLE